jgi:hypothetical protein
VMLLVSFLNLFVESLELASYLNVSLAFTTGSIIMIIIDARAYVERIIRNYTVILSGGKNFASSIRVN